MSLTRTARRALPTIDRLLARSTQPFLRRRRSAHVLVTATGSGNIGDQAMLEAFLEHVTGPVVVVTSARDALQIDPRPGLQHAVLPGLVRAFGRQHWTALARFVRILSGARSLTVTGADIMDGGYDPSASVARWNLLLMAAQRGVDAQVLGFSWNGDAPSQVLAQARRAGRAGVRMLSRDPLSLSRMQRDGIAGARATADSVFLLSGEDGDFREARWIEERAGRRIAVVNASALVARSVDLETELRPVIADLLRRDFDVVLLPHVDRGQAGDVHQCRLLATGTDPERVLLIERLLRPRQVRWIAGRAELVVSGRMHLAIMALSQGTPSIVVATQGKVEGLAQMFESPDLVVTPALGMGARITEVATDESIAQARERISAALPRVRRIAAENFTQLA